jgi:D-xylose transport system permease protein
VLGWILAIGTVAIHAYVTLRRAAVRRAEGLQTQPLVVLIGKILLVAVPVLAATAYLSIERSPNPARVSIKGVPLVVLVLLVLLVGLTFLLARTAFGRHVYAVGGNAEAARRAGINVRQVKMMCFVICSMLAAVGGIMLASRNNSISPTTGGADTLLYAVGAAVIGGTSLFGGKGQVIDAVLGGLVIAVIINGMGLLNQPSSTVYMVTGAVLLVAASVDAISRRRAASTGRL